jgi:hypothetical protein
MHGHRIMSSPFDYMYIDFESALQCIQDEFANYTKDIVIFNKERKIGTLFNQRNTKELLPEIQYLLDTEAPIIFNTENYTEETLFFNQNYIDYNNTDNKNNLYKWKTICLFFHHNMALHSSVNTLDRRSRRLMKCINTRNTLLVYINQNTGFTDLKLEIEKYRDLIMKYVPREKYPNIYFAIILYSEHHPDCFFYTEPYLFMVKNISTDTYWEDMQFGTQYEILLHHFEIVLIEKKDLDNEI